MERPISSAALTQVQEAIFGGRKMEAIKLYRTDTGAGLKEAKEAVEKLEAEWRVTSPEKFTKPNSAKGCGPIILIGWGLILLLLLFLGQCPHKVVLEGEGSKATTRVEK